MIDNEKSGHGVIQMLVFDVCMRKDTGKLKAGGAATDKQRQRQKQQNSPLAAGIHGADRSSRVGVAGPDAASAELSSGGPLWLALALALALELEPSESSDELEMLRPGMAGRRRGERYDGGLKERARLAILTS